MCNFGKRSDCNCSICDCNYITLLLWFKCRFNTSHANCRFTNDRPWQMHTRNVEYLKQLQTIFTNRHLCVQIIAHSAKHICKSWNICGSWHLRILLRHISLHIILPLASVLRAHLQTLTCSHSHSCTHTHTLLIKCVITPQEEHIIIDPIFERLNSSGK